MAKTEKPSRAAAMKWKCHECMGGYADGRKDCEITVCALYPWMPYRKKKPDLTWMKYNPSRVGEEEWDPREMSEEQRDAARERLKKARMARGKDEDEDKEEDEGADEGSES